VKSPFRTVYYKTFSDGRICVLHWKNRYGPLAVPLMLAGIGMQAYGQYQAGEEANAVAQYNQQVKQREAEAEEQKAIIQSRKQAQEASRRIAEIRAGFGISGVASTAGTPLAILAEQTRQSELENREIGYEGTQQSTRLRNEGEMIAYEGRSARRASRIGAGATLLTGFGKVYS
jgi:hypothetical protein